MISAGKRNICGILVDAVDYEAVEAFVLRAVQHKQPAAISALAVHGIMTGVLDRHHKYRLNRFDLIVPDGQPVRWALNFLHRAGLNDRVYGPNLMRRLCALAAGRDLSIYLYGSTPEILQKLRVHLQQTHPQGLRIAGMEPSKFRRISEQERSDLVSRIRQSGADLLFVGLGCPRQEIFAYEITRTLPIPAIAVGAAFPFLAGKLQQAPEWVQRRGFEWLFRLCSEPRRLWRRYLYLNPAYLTLVALQASGFSQRPDNGIPPAHEERFG